MRLTSGNSLTIAAIATLVLPLAAFAQTTQPSSSATTPKPPTTTSPATPKPATPATTSTSVVGIWTGQVTETGRSRPFSITVTIDSKGATTDYPEQGCAGKLTRVGASGAYVFYSEKITKGAYDAAKGTGCIDGTVVVTKAGSNLLFSWFGTVDNQAVHASATLGLSKPKI